MEKTAASTRNLPALFKKRHAHKQADVEQAFKGEAQARGLSLDEVLSEAILSRAEHVAVQSAVAGSLSVQLMREEGVPMLPTGQPMGISVVDETLDRIRRERESAVLGRSN